VGKALEQEAVLAPATLPRRALSVEEVSEVLGLSTIAVRKLIWSGELRHRRIERADGRGRILVPVEAVEEWLGGAS
jgi:excisionase family DNA binding protein